MMKEDPAEFVLCPGMNSCHDTQVEVKGQLSGLSSLLSLWVSVMKVRSSIHKLVWQVFHPLSYLAGP